MNLFQNVKYGVNCHEVAERYGLTVRRGGMTCCLFHKSLQWTSPATSS